MSFLAILVVLGLRAQQTDSFEGPFQPRPARVSDERTDGIAVLVPNTVQAAAIGSYELRLTVGRQGIAPGGGIVVGFPKAWFTNPFPIAKRLQTADRTKPHFLSVSASRGGAALDVLIDNIGFTGKVERFNQTIAAIVTQPLQAGDIIAVTLSNTTAPYIAGSDEVNTAVDADGSKRFRRIRSPAHYDVVPGPAEDVVLVAPTETAVGRPVTLQMTAFDRFANVATGFTGSATIAGIEPRQNVRLSPGDRGSSRLTWTPRKEGFYFPEATVRMNDRGTSLSVKGNPVRVFATEPETRTYWGDLHSHSAISADGIGNDPFSYARNAARLDFFASTEHADDDGIMRQLRGAPTTPPLGASAIRPEDWEAIKARVEKFNEAGRFVTLLAYECSLGTPSGHHNVFFRSTDGLPWRAGLVRSVETLWSKIAAGDAITIPHHTGIAFVGAPPGAESAGPDLQPIVTATDGPITVAGLAANWSVDNPALRPLLEIYSLHGSSERYDPQDRLAYENARFTFSRSMPGAHYARDAWAAGLQLGVIAASDNHSAQPGQPHGGLTAVRATRLTRDAVFNALAKKHTYGTTGQRIYMDLEIAGVKMGQSGRASGPIDGHLTIAAPSDIARAELVRYDLQAGEYVVAHHWDDAGRLLETTFRDEPQERRVMYYVRLQLRDPVRGRPARGWSSPVWLDRIAQP